MGEKKRGIQCGAGGLHGMQREEMFASSYNPFCIV